MIQMKLLWKRMLCLGAIAFLLYLFAGAVLSSVQHKRVDEQFSSSFAPEACYGDDTGSERVLCIDDNREALLWRLRVIETAEKQLVLSTFDLQGDNSGVDVMSALFAAAERGVNIQILVDGMNGLLHLPGSPEFKALAAHPLVEAKLYNPIHLLKPWKFTFRLHDKYLIADDQVYILGGRNTNDLFLGDYDGKANMDRDLLVYETDPEVEDNSLGQVQGYFDRIWQQDWNRSIDGKETARTEKAAESLRRHYQQLQERYPAAFEDTDYEAATVETRKITLLTNPQAPENRKPELWHMLSRLMMDRERVVIQTPYMICSQDMYQDLKAVCDTTGRVEMITNAIESGANPWGCADYLNQKENIQETGIVTYEFPGQRSNHGKTMLIDDRISIVGSFNLDMRSAYLDTEMMLVVDSGELNAQLTQTMEGYMAQSKKVSPDGSVEYGAQYGAAPLSAGKNLFYSVLKVLIRPFRHML